MGENMEDASVVMSEQDNNQTMYLPPGFRFHPMDEEIITHYLREKVVDSSFSARAIGEVDLNKCEPWDLPGKAKMGEKEWYFFCQRDKKYPTGMRTNRATEAGYWKATGKDKEIYKGRGNLVGMKKTLVFYKGRAPKGEKTNWVMHEYRLEGKSSFTNLPITAKEEWVVCRVFHKNNTTTGVLSQKTMGFDLMNSTTTSSGDDDHYMESPTLPSLMDFPYLNSHKYGDECKAMINMNMGQQHQQQEQERVCGKLFPTSNNQMTQFNMNNPSTSSSFYPHQIPPQTPFFVNMGYSSFLNGEEEEEALTLRRRCKEEDQYSYHSLISASDQETTPAMISSVASRLYDDHLEGPSPSIDLDNLWKY